MWHVKSRPARCIGSKRPRTAPPSVAPLERPERAPLERPERAPVEDVVAAPQPDPSPADSGEDRDVIAVVLADGTIRQVSDPAASERHHPRWRSGRLCGPGWVLWWELRSWEDGATC